jgi:hypothetical protein
MLPWQWYTGTRREPDGLVRTVIPDPESAQESNPVRKFFDSIGSSLDFVDTGFDHLACAS